MMLIGVGQIWVAAAIGLLSGVVIGASSAWYVQGLKLARVVAEYEAEQGRMEAQLAKARADLAEASEKVVTRYITKREVVRVEADNVKQEIDNAAQVVDALSDPRCAVPERVRDAINAFRLAANSESPGSSEGPMRDAVRGDDWNTKRVGRVGR
ncbi:MAG: hypothetical protein ACK4XK_09765 [Casimicrobiaceae bacterium]